MKSDVRILELRSRLNQANIDYYVHASPTISDGEYDCLLNELLSLELANPSSFDPNSPTQRVGGEPLDSFSSVRHAHPMQSIDNTYTIDELVHWYSKLGKQVQCVCDPKIDGVAISIRYEEGELVQAVTRGDGERGDDVTAQVKTIRSIPLKLLGDFPSLIEIRGEIFMSNSSFKRINEKRELNGEQLFANARNATAGTLKSLNPKVVAERNLSFLMHGKGELDWDKQPDTWINFVEIVKTFGIPVSDKIISCNSAMQIQKAVEAFEIDRKKLGFGVDGMVVRVNSFVKQEELGATSKSPRWCIAFKYPAEQGRTKLLAVDWQVGKNGTLTPRATMKPILLAGTTVSHATLHNIVEIHRKDIRVGDDVVIEKAGEIIPQVIGFVLESRDGTQKQIEPPESCPNCASPVEQEGPKLYCVNPECPAQFREKVKWFAGRDQMDIEGLGDKVVDQLIDAGLVKHFADLYHLKSKDLFSLDGFAKKSADALVEAINASKNRGLSRVLSSVGIRLVGRATAKTIVRKFSSLEKLQHASLEDFIALPDFGRITAETLYKAIHSPQGVNLFNRLSDAGVNLQSKTPSGVSQEFSGMTFVITGSLELWDRKALAEELENRGGKVSSSISKNTSVLIAGEKAGSKLQKAFNLEIEVWDDEKLADRLSL